MPLPRDGDGDGWIYDGTPAARRVDARAPGDLVAARQAIYDAMLGAVQDLKAENERYVLRLRQPEYADPETFDPARERQAVLSGGSLGRRIRGVWELIDKATGKLVDAKTATVVTAPYLSPRGVFVRRGLNYTLAMQQRLRPSAFIRRRGSGELEAHVNVMPGEGLGGKLVFEPENGRFVWLAGQVRVPLVLLLKAMGVPAPQIEAAWGRDLYAANMTRLDEGTLKRLHAKLLGNRPVQESIEADIRQAMESAPLDPEVTKRVVGRPHDRISADLLMDLSKQILDINRAGEEPEDARDDLANLMVMGQEDLLAERLKRSQGILAKALWKATRTGKLDHIGAGLLEGQVDAVLQGSGLGQPGEGVNPVLTLDQIWRVTRKGVGGISSNDSIPESARAVHPSQYGYVDPVTTPESSAVGVDSRLAYGTLKGRDGRLYTRFRNVRTGQLDYVAPDQLAGKTVAFPREFDRNAPYVRALRNGRLEYVPPAEVDYVLPAPQAAGGFTFNLVPLASTMKPHRAVMAGRMISQALPLVGGEAPLVRNALPTRGINSPNGSPQAQLSFDSVAGLSAGAVRASGGGTVVDVRPDRIRIRRDDGQVEEKLLYNHLPNNYKSVAGDTRVFIRREDGTLWKGRIADYAFALGDRVLSIDPTTRKTAWKRVLGYLRHGNDKRMFRVTFRSGRHVDVTEDHSLITMGDDGQARPVLPEQCTPKRTYSPVVPLLRESLGTIADYEGFALTGDLGTIIGLYLADGNPVKGRKSRIHQKDSGTRVKIAVQPDDRAAQIIEVCQRLGWSYARRSDAVYINHKVFRNWLIQHFRHGAGAKRLPAFVYQAPREFQEAMLAAYLSDGTISADRNGVPQLHCYSTSQDLRDDVVDLLTMFAVYPTVRTAEVSQYSDNWNDAYGFRIPCAHLDRLPRWFFYNDKQQDLKTILAARAATKTLHPVFEVIPVTRTSRRLLRRAHTGQPVPLSASKSAGQRAAVAKADFVDATGPYGEWARSDVWWDRINTIEELPDTDSEVFDLCVEESEMFAVNGGIVVHNTALHQSPVVQKGQRVEEGQLLARSNYTDADGSLALGLNARVGWLATGKNYEDAISVSRSFANRATSEHYYQPMLELNADLKTGKDVYTALFPGTFDKAILDQFDKDGVIQPGTKVKKGDPLILAAKRRSPRHGVLHRGRGTNYADASVTWDHDHEGEVIDAVKTRKGLLVLVRTTSPLEVGDKLAGRAGNKGIVSEIIDDDDMPRDEDGQPFEVLMNPMGLISRVNTSQALEATLGKIAAKLGHPLAIEDFDTDKDMARWVYNLAKQHGVRGRGSATDPRSGRTIPRVHQGTLYMMKLHHQAEAKESGRGAEGYTAEGMPAKGGPEGSKRVSLADVRALLSHGATATIRDAGAVRGQANAEYWQRIMAGHDAPPPVVPKVYEKFLATLTAAGLNPVPEGPRTRLMALTRSAIEGLTGARELKNAETLDLKTAELKPIAGGLFDDSLTGGAEGNQWAAIRLHEPLPSPAFEEPIRWILNLTEPKFRAILAGRETLEGQTGPRAIADALERLDVKAMLAQAREQVQSRKGAGRDRAARVLGVLKSAQSLGIHPRDWVWDRVPVLPPKFRPVSLMQGSKTPLVADANVLYRELFDANQALRQLSGAIEDTGDERLTAYDALKAVVGLGDPVTPESQKREVKGFLRAVWGDSPKHGFVQRKLLGSTVDLVGRAVIAPDPNLDLDQIAIPEGRAWKVFEPLIFRRLRRRGVSPTEALTAIEQRTPLGRQALLDELKERPVLASRAPVLHRYGVMGFRPVLTQGHAMKLNPLVYKGFGADNNGDSCVSALVPIRVGGEVFLGPFDEFVRRYLIADYDEAVAVDWFGRRTSIFELHDQRPVEVLGLDAAGRPAWQTVTHFSIHTSHGPDCYRVTTTDGLDAVFTAHHNFWQLTSDCRLVAVKTEAVGPGALLPWTLGVEPPFIQDHAPADAPRDFVLDFAAGFWFGHHFADGSLTGRADTVSQTSWDPELLQWLQNQGDRILGVPSWRTRDGRQARWTNRAWHDFFLTHLGKNAEGKRLPGWMLTAPREFRTGLIAGFLAGDGNPQPGCVRSEIVNRPLLLALKLVAATLGVPSSITPGRPENAAGEHPRWGKQATWYWRLNRERLAGLAIPWPACATTKPFQALRTHGRDTHRVWDQVPFPMWLDRLCRRISRRRHRLACCRPRCVDRAPAAGPRPSAKEIYGAIAAGSGTRRLARRLIDVYGLRHLKSPRVRRWIAMVEDETLCWTRIETLDRVERPDVTYDFSVAGHQAFAIDGVFLTHNTMNYQPVMDDQAVQEVYEKMLPSRNLFSATDFKVHQLPQQEFVAGLYLASTAEDKDLPPLEFDTEEDAIRAWERGELQQPGREMDLGRRVRIRHPKA